MNIKKYVGKKVVITTKEQETFSGTVINYVFPEDNVPKGESIVIRTIEGMLIEFRPEEMIEINELK